MRASGRGVSLRAAKIVAALEAAKGHLVPVDRLVALMRHAGLSDSENSITGAICALSKAITARAIRSWRGEMIRVLITVKGDNHVCR